MNQIKFSHKYKKLLTGRYDEACTSARLIEVLPVKIENLSLPFLAYDTENDKFKLPPMGNYLLLIFQDITSDQLFTTLRSSSPQKKTYYQAEIGKIFEIVIKE